jgi:lauroyl/myristoyl acyltransferase
MNLDTVKKVLLWLVITFVVVSVWTNPENAAQTAGDFLGTVAGFFSDLVDRTSRFITNLGTNGSETPSQV